MHSERIDPTPAVGYMLAAPGTRLGSVIETINVMAAGQVPGVNGMISDTIEEAHAVEYARGMPQGYPHHLIRVTVEYVTEHGNV